MNKTELKKFLDILYEKYKNKYSSKDPVWILHKFHDEKDIEIAGLLTSCYAYGQVDLINRFVNRFLTNINFKVYEFTSNFSQQKDKKFLKGLNYRFNTDRDLSLLIKNIHNIIAKYKSLKNFFLLHYDKTHENILPALSEFTKELNKISDPDSYQNFLIPLVDNKSTCKRLNLFLRWMVRKDDIDTGIWNEVDKAKLIMPVDTHIFRISRKLNLVNRKTCDLKFAIELTEKLKQFDKDDPVKYDFALCHVGIDKKSVI